MDRNDLDVPGIHKPHVALVVGPKGYGAGIGRYALELSVRLPSIANMRIVTQRHLPTLMSVPGFLPHFPIGLSDSIDGAIAHFTRVMGCAQLIWQPIHPAIVTVHDLGPLVCPEDEAFLKGMNRSIFNLQLRGLRRADWWIVNSEQTREHLIRHLNLPRERIHWVQLGVDLSSYRPGLQEEARVVIERELGLSKIPTLVDILYVGNEMPRKGLRYLLEALAILRNDGHGFRLLKAGPSGGSRWRSELEAQIRAKGLTSSVEFIGFVPEPQLPYLYAFADIYVTPTLLEGGFTWTAMEAMACGIPVVATTAALIRDEARSGAIVVPPRDSVALAEALRSLILSESLRSELGGHGCRAVEPFTWDATVESLRNVYRQVCTS